MRCGSALNARLRVSSQGFVLSIACPPPFDIGFPDTTSPHCAVPSGLQQPYDAGCSELAYARLSGTTGRLRIRCCWQESQPVDSLSQKAIGYHHAHTHFFSFSMSLRRSRFLPMPPSFHPLPNPQRRQRPRDPANPLQGCQSERSTLSTCNPCYQ